MTQPEGNLIAVGADAAEPHHVGDDARRISAGECVLVDLFPKSASLEFPVFSDCSRTFCVGAELPQAQPLVAAAADVVTVKECVTRELESQLQSGGSAQGFRSTADRPALSSVVLAGPLRSLKLERSSI